MEGAENPQTTQGVARLLAARATPRFVPCNTAASAFFWCRCHPELSARWGLRWPCLPRGVGAAAADGLLTLEPLKVTWMLLNPGGVQRPMPLRARTAGEKQHEQALPPCPRQGEEGAARPRGSPGRSRHCGGAAGSPWLIRAPKWPLYHKKIRLNPSIFRKKKRKRQVCGTASVMNTSC